MLQLKNIVKEYQMGDLTIKALSGINLTFRKNDFVSILGPSGCGKTTMLNIIGGLDRYTSGDLIINGISTEEYKDNDWDIYRNNSIGFVFQNYNLIPHQTVLSNVELAMTLAGVSKEERRKNALEALDKVGLSDQLHKKPTQMSGGQMQRVAIARALVNNPDILLADEPTGALDSETSIQIMKILKEVAKDRLVIMVTHNSELAEEYSTRIIRLLDGKVIRDSNPYEAPEEKATKKKRRKVSMSFMTALSLSFKNLLTKKTRTLLTAFAGSIGIIGIALILSLSNGMNAYVSNLEEDTLSTYPLEIETQAIDMTGMMSTMMSNNNKEGIAHELDKVYSNNIITSMMNSMATSSSKNDLKHFKEYLESADGKAFAEHSNSIKYGYDIDLQIYKEDEEKGNIQVNPSDLLNDIGMGGRMNSSSSPMGGTMSSMANMSSSFTGGLSTDVWDELLSNEDLLKSQYDVIAGEWPSAYNEIVLVVDENNEISDYTLYTLGLLDQSELEDIQTKIANGEAIEDTTDISSFSYDDLLAQRFKLLLNTDYYAKENGRWVDKKDDTTYMDTMLANAQEIKVVGILRPNAEATATSINGSVGYTTALTEYVINEVDKTEIAKEQKENPERDVFTGVPFETADLTMEDINYYVSTLPLEEQGRMTQMLSTLSEEESLAMMQEQMQLRGEEKATYESNSSLLGIVDFNNPDSISLYPKNFDSKEELTTLLDAYNGQQTDEGKEEFVINYTDTVGIMTSSISSIIDVISYVLIACVAISLIVSSVMIAIITYISVLERTKEIGILRSIGASKKDISRLFNAETVIEGLVAGILGILITLLLTIPLNSVIESVVGISGLAALPWLGALGLILLSVLLTVIAGFIPAKIAAKKDPVEALRSE